MSRQINDLTGRRFGRLTVLALMPERKNGQPVWLCRCECGRTAEVRKGNLLSGQTSSCGCLRRRQQEESGGEEISESTPYPVNEDCANYDAERNECRALKEPLCATRGTCSFFKQGKTP